MAKGIWCSLDITEQFKIGSIRSICRSYGVFFTGKRMGWPKQVMADRARIVAARARMRLSAKRESPIKIIAIMAH